MVNVLLKMDYMTLRNVQYIQIFVSSVEVVIIYKVF